MSRHVLPHAPSPTITSFFRMAAITATKQKEQILQKKTFREWNQWPFFPFAAVLDFHFSSNHPQEYSRTPSSVRVPPPARHLNHLQGWQKPEVNHQHRIVPKPILLCVSYVIVLHQRDCSHFVTASQTLNPCIYSQSDCSIVMKEKGGGVQTSRDMEECTIRLRLCPVCSPMQREGRNQTNKQTNRKAPRKSVQLVKHSGMSWSRPNTSQFRPRRLFSSFQSESCRDQMLF